jgi:hypothetical protein
MSTSFPKDLDIITPLKAKTKPTPLNGDVVYTLEKPMRREFTSKKIRCKDLPNKLE